MPLYLDRHDLSGVTPEEIVKAHENDLRVAPKHDVDFLAYWFDADLGTAFCLARAPGAENVAAAHDEAHGLVQQWLEPLATLPPPGFPHDRPPTRPTA